MDFRGLISPSGQEPGASVASSGGSAAAARPSSSHWYRRALAAVLTMFLMVTGMVATTSAAHADTPGINIALLHGGQVIGDDAIVPEGDDILLRVQYDANQPIDGIQIVFTLPAGITAPSSLPSNEAIESIVDNGDGTYTVTFRNPIPDDVSEGAFALNLKAGPVDEDTPIDISWTIGEDAGGVRIVVENDVPPVEEITDGYNKSVNPSNLDGFVQRGDAPEYEFLGLDPTIADAVLTYTLVLSSSEARSGYSIEDELAAGLGFVGNSFEATLTTAEGAVPFTFAPTVTGNTFSGIVDVPEQSTLRITYEVQVTDIEALETLLQAQFDARNDTPGNYEILLPNDAVFGGEHERSVNVRIRGNIPGVGIGNNFDKWGNWSLRDVITDADGNLQPSAEMIYTLHANLTPWDDRNANFTLQQNVVISDDLIEQASWNTGDAEFITITGDGPIQSLTEATGFDGSAADFADDEYVGLYALVGQMLLINVGKNNTTNVNIQVKAQLDTVDGLTGSDNTTVVDGIHYPWNNRAQFHYRDGNPVDRDHNAGVVVLPDDYEGGVDDSAVFNKSAVNDEVQVSPGESAQVPYRFTIDTSKDGIDPLKSKIVDEINTEVFDITNIDGTVAVSGSYGETALDAGHFSISADENGQLVIVLSDAGKALVGGLEAGQQWIVDLVLTTAPFDGKQTFEIYNKATLIGEDQEWDYVSDDESEATSFGNEAELRKRIYDSETGEWVAEIDAAITDGEFVENRFVYSIELIPRGNYGSEFPVTIFTREDVLPDAVEFLGFVETNEDGVPDLDSTYGGPADLNGNVIAEYADGVVTIRQEDGTNLNPSEGRIVTFFAVEATDAGAAIVNTIAGSDTTINPVGDPSIDIEKWNDEGAVPEYNDSGALLNDGFDGDFDETPGKALAVDTPLPINFTISNDGREDLVDIVVSDQLTDGAGAIQDLTCDFSPLGGPATGTVWDGPFLIADQFNCTGTLPALKKGDTHSNTASVTAVGSKTGEEVDDEDEWHGWVPTPSIDIEKWNDEGEAPEYDEFGTLLNDGYDGDFDKAPGKPLKANAMLPINFTISNDGEEDLVNVFVSDQLTEGVGEIHDLVCVFPDESEGTEWSGPFTVGTQFDCTGTLPALEAGDFHADNAQVTGVGISSGIVVDDADEWHAYVPVPGVDIEKWSDEGETPEYDESGALINDGYNGDFDKSPGKELTAGKDQRINFTVSNNGAEPLVDVVVTDRLVDGKGHIKDLVCAFPDESTGTTWSGPFAVGTQFDCTGTLPGLNAGEVHADTAEVTGYGLYSGLSVNDSDDWHGTVPKAGATGGLPVTGGTAGTFAVIGALLLLLAGGGAVLYSRRRRADA